MKWQSKAISEKKIITRINSLSHLLWSKRHSKVTMALRVVWCGMQSTSLLGPRCQWHPCCLEHWRWGERRGGHAAAALTGWWGCSWFRCAKDWRDHLHAQASCERSLT